MVCKNCGAENDDMLQYCQECGAPLEEPIVINKASLKESLAKNEKKREAEDDGKFFSFSKACNAIMDDTYRLLALVSGLCIYLSAYMKWLVGGRLNVKIKLFDFAKNERLENRNVINILIFVIMFMGICMILYSFREFFKPTKRIKKNKIVWTAVLVISVLIFVYIFMTIQKNYVLPAKEGGHVYSFGEGFYMNIVGMVLYFFSLFMGILDNKTGIKHQWL